MATARKQPTLLSDLPHGAILALADTWAASGTGHTKPPVTGFYVHVHRNSGTAANTLTIVDGAGTTLATNTTSGVDLAFSFNGTAWVQTP